MNIKAVKSDVLSKHDERYVIIDLDTGEILDDCQGYGYKTKQKAHIGYAYKTRDKSKLHFPHSKLHTFLKRP